MNKEAMKKRTNQFGLQAIRLCEALPDTPVARVIRHQILRCVTSVGVNYPAAESPQFPLGVECFLPIAGCRVFERSHRLLPEGLHRAACHAKSKADFISKMGTVEEETDESLYLMELIMDAVLLKEELITDFYQGADDLISTVVSSIQTAKRRIE